MKPGKLLLVSALGWQSLTLLSAAPAASPTTGAAPTPAPTAPAEAPKAGLTGQVRDSRNDLPLFEAKIAVAGSSEVVLTDASGTFLLSGKAAKVTVTKDGYQDKTMDLKGDTTNVTIKLTPAASEFDDEVYTLGSFDVVADMLDGSPARMQAIKMDSVTSFSGLTSADFSRLALPDAAAALQRVTGVSIQEGKYAVIRGLGDRYTSTTLNGVMLPSPDPDRQAVQLDLFPSGVLDNVKATKTFVPDQPGTSSGGSIQLETKGVPEERMIKLEVSTSFNSATGNERFLQTKSRTRDAWANGASDREIPLSAYGLPTNPQSPLQIAQAQATAEQMGRNLSLRRFAPDPNYGLKATYGDRFQTKGWGRIGVIANVNYSNSSKFIENGTYNRLVVDQFTGLTPANILVGGVPGYRLQTFEQSETERSLGGLVGIAWQASDEHIFKYNRLHLRSGINSGFRVRGTVYYDSLGESPVTVGERLSYLERVLDTHQFNGEHQFLDDRLSLAWNYTQADSAQKEPDLRQTSARESLDLNNNPFLNSAGGASFLEIPYRSWRDIYETMEAGRADLTFKTVTNRQWENTLKTGVNYSTSERSYKEDTIPLQFVNGNFIRKQEDFNKLYPSGAPLVTGDVDATRENKAYYGQVEQRIFEKLRLVGGARLESNKVSAHAKVARLAGTIDGSFTNVRSGFEQEDVLPSFTAIYDLTPEMNLRASWSKTVALPSYREISPYYSRSFIGGDIDAGNENLKNSDVTNYDLGWQWNRPNGDNYSISLFYKEITNAIEKIQGYVIPGTNLVQTTFASGTLYSWYNNPAPVTLTGFEVEARKNLGFISERMSDFHVGTGLTWIESIAEQQPFEAAAKFGAYSEATRPLVGQPGLILNAELGYANPDQKFEATLSYYLIGDRLNAAGLNQSFDVYDLSYQTVDFVVSKGLGERWRLRVAAKNLTDSKREKAYFLDDKEIGGIPLRDSYRVGRSYSLSLSCDF